MTDRHPDDSNSIIEALFQTTNILDEAEQKREVLIADILQVNETLKSRIQEAIRYMSGHVFDTVVSDMNCTAYNSIQAGRMICKLRQMILPPMAKIAVLRRRIDNARQTVAIYDVVRKMVLEAAKVTELLKLQKLDECVQCGKRALLDVEILPEANVKRVLANQLRTSLHQVEDQYLKRLTEQVGDLGQAKLTTDRLLSLGKLSNSRIAEELGSRFSSQLELSLERNKDANPVDVLYELIREEIANFTRYECSVLVDHLALKEQDLCAIRTQLRKCYQLRAEEVVRRQNFTSLNDILPAITTLEQLTKELDGFDKTNDISAKYLLKCDSKLLDAGICDCIQELKTFLVNDQWISCPALTEPDLGLLPEFRFLGASAADSATKQSAEQKSNEAKDQEIILTNTSLFILRTLGKFINCATYAEAPFKHIKRFICQMVELYCAAVLEFFVHEFCPYGLKTSQAFIHLSKNENLRKDGRLCLSKALKQLLMSDSLANLQTRVVAVESIHTLQLLIGKLRLSAIASDFSGDEFNTILKEFCKYHQCLQSPVYYGSAWWAVDSSLVLNKQMLDVSKAVNILTQQLDDYMKLFELASPPVPTPVRVLLLKLIIDRVENNLPGSDRGVRLLLCDKIQTRISQLKEATSM